MQYAPPSDLRKSQEFIVKNLFFGALLLKLIYECSSDFILLHYPLFFLETVLTVLLVYSPYVFFFLWALKKSLHRTRFYYTNFISIIITAFTLIYYLQFGYLILAEQAINKLCSQTTPVKPFYTPFIYGPYSPFLNSLQHALDYEQQEILSMQTHIKQVEKKLENFNRTICERRLITNARTDIKKVFDFIEKFDNTLSQHLAEIEDHCKVSFRDPDLKTYFNETILEPMANHFIETKNFIAFFKTKYQIIDNIYQHFGMIYGDYYVEGKAITFIQHPDEERFNNLVCQLETHEATFDQN